MRSILIVVTLLGLARSAVAQTRYRFSPGDTLVYHAENQDSSVITTEAGSVPALTLSESTVRLVIGTRGSATAAFTAFKVLLRTPKGDVMPDPSGALNRPFSLTLSPRGLAQTNSAPTFPQALSQVVDLTTEFDDFFIVLPARPLAIGVAWADTVDQTGSTAAGLRFTRHSIANYSVARDTTIGGVKAFVIVSASSQTLEGVGPGPGPGKTVTNHQSGSENGLVLFDAAGGRMLGRRRAGEYSGSLKVTGGPAVTEYPLTRRIMSGMELLLKH